MLFHKTKQEIEKEYKDYITSSWDKTNTLIMTDTDTAIGRYPMSDVILSFDANGNLAIQCERAYKSHYNEKDWATMAFRALSDVSEVEDSEGIVTACTYSNKYIDYIKYKKEWLDWADEIVHMQRQ